MSHILELTDVHRSFGSPPVHACNGVSLSVDEGEFVAIVGPSGSGKSTVAVAPSKDWGASEAAFVPEQADSVIPAMASIASVAARRGVRGRLTWRLRGCRSTC